MQPAVMSSHSSALDTSSRRRRALFTCVAALSLAGVIVSAISVERHYAKSATQFCDFNQKFSCDIVNRSAYSSIMGIPVAGIGVAGYGLLLLLSSLWREREETPGRLLGAAAVGLIFALYLTYVEAYVLTAWCVLCLLSLALIAIITLLAAVIRFSGARARSIDVS
jgi:vitamin-K-epoxide reductase (warfarin-sensitive)